MNLHEALVASEMRIQVDDLSRLILLGIEHSAFALGKPIRLNLSQAALVLVHGGTNGVITGAEYETFTNILNKAVEGFKIKTTQPDVELRLRLALERLA